MTILKVKTWIADKNGLTTYNDQANGLAFTYRIEKVTDKAIQLKSNPIVCSKTIESLKGHKFAWVPKSQIEADFEIVEGLEIGIKRI